MAAKAKKRRLFRGAETRLPFDARRARRELTAADPKLAKVIEAVGPFRLSLDTMADPFASLAESIVYQQLTGKAAATIFARVMALYPPRRKLTPEDILGTSTEKLRACGLSRAKTAALQDLAEKTRQGVVPKLRALRTMSDDEIVERLTEVRGIGRWTVEMMLIFRLGRPDVLPVTDYGIRKGFLRTFRTKDLPTPAELLARGERWRPWRTMASWYLWRCLELDGKKSEGRA